MMKNKKAQVWAIDLVVSMVLFIGIILLFYRFAISFTPDYSQVNNLIKEGGYVTNTLRSTGYPPNWSDYDIDDVYSIGLMDENGFLNKTKVVKFREWAGDDGNPGAYYSQLKSKINTRYDYYIEFWNGTKYLDEVDGIGPIGKNFDGQGANQVIKFQRLVPYNDGSVKPLKLILYLWTTESA
jgi:hypothetical protein